MGIQSLLFPTRDLCYFCKDRTPYLTGYICSDCRERLVFMNKEVNMESEYISQALYCITYNRYLKELVHGFKFNGKSYLYKPFGEIMISTIKEMNIKDIDLIAYIPIHRRKEAIRGYNQSELLASYIAKELDVSISMKNLVKIKWTKEQNTLDRIQRLKNLKDSFYIKNPSEFYNKSILLIDDIITTGSTFNECSRLLIEKGAKAVTCLALTSSKSM